LLWAWLSAVWREWQSALAIVKPATVIGWHRQGFRLFWHWKIRRGKPGRPGVPKEIRSLIRKMSRENPVYGEFLSQAAIGVSYKPRQCGRQRYESRPIGDVPSPVAGSGNRPSSPACVRYPL
jgi:hypothetical protein